MEKEDSTDIAQTNSKEAFLAELESLRPDLMYPEDWDSKTVDLINRTVNENRPVRKMFDSIPMLCKGNKCPQAQVCPLYAKHIEPVGEKCPIELAMIRDFASALGKSLNIDFDDLTEVSQLRVLVDQEIQYIRKSSLQAIEGLVVENVIGINDKGEAITKRELSPAVDLEDRIHRRQRDIRKDLIATRAERAKVTGSDADVTQVAAKLLKQISMVNQQRDALLAIEMSDVLDAEVIED